MSPEAIARMLIPGSWHEEQKEDVIKKRANVITCAINGRKFAEKVLRGRLSYARVQPDEKIKSSIADSNTILHENAKPYLNHINKQRRLQDNNKKELLPAHDEKTPGSIQALVQASIYAIQKFPDVDACSTKKKWCNELKNYWLSIEQIIAQKTDVSRFQNKEQRVYGHVNSVDGYMLFGNYIASWAEAVRRFKNLIPSFNDEYTAENLPGKAEQEFNAFCAYFFYNKDFAGDISNQQKLSNEDLQTFKYLHNKMQEEKELTPLYPGIECTQQMDEKINQAKSWFRAYLQKEYTYQAQATPTGIQNIMFHNEMEVCDLKLNTQELFEAVAGDLYDSCRNNSDPQKRAEAWIQFSWDMNKINAALKNSPHTISCISRAANGIELGPKEGFRPVFEPTQMDYSTPSEWKEVIKNSQQVFGARSIPDPHTLSLKKDKKLCSQIEKEKENTLGPSMQAQSYGR